MANKRVGIIGAGNIGGFAWPEAKSLGYEVDLVLNSRGVVHLDGIEHGYLCTFQERGNVPEMLDYISLYHSNLDLVFLALPSGGDGETETNFIEYFGLHNIPMVTAGKSAFANCYERLMPYRRIIGNRATVGGATGILPFLKEELDFERPFIVDLVVNGTLSYVVSQIWEGYSLETAIGNAITEKYAEPPPPGEKANELDIMRGECQDVGKKLNIIVADVFLDYIGCLPAPGDIKVEHLTPHYLDEVTAQNARMKYVVRIGSSYKPLVRFTEGAPGSVHALFQTGNGRRLIIHGGFCEIPQGSAMDKWIPHGGPGNAVRIDQGGVPLLKVAAGAGPRATWSSMKKDALLLCPPH